MKIAIARLQFGELRVAHRLSEAGEAFEIRLMQVDQADWLAGRREVQWAYVKIFQLAWREKG